MNAKRIVCACAASLLSSATMADSIFTPFVNTFAVANASDASDNDPGIENQVDGEGYYDTSADVEGASAHIVGQPSVISYTAASEGADMFALAFSIESFLAVSTETDVLAEWDFRADTAEDLWITSYIIIEDFVENTVVLSVGRDTPVGRRVVGLLPGRDYFWTGAAVAFDGSGTSWFTLTPYDCPADFNRDGFLDLFDFLAFVNAFNAGEGDRADCDTSGALDLFDFLCFLNAFNAGC